MCKSPAETGLYYLQSRYYDPTTDRFINADAVVSTNQGVLGCNGFAYCNNNPVVRVDSQGGFWETLFDFISLGASIVDVCNNPKDPWAWAGLVGDVIDLIPFVTCVGETVKAAKTVNKVIDAADDVHDVIKTVDNASDVAKAVNKVDDVADVAKKVHGNSLKTTKSAVGYALRQKGTHEIMKYGETTRGLLRYTKKFYDENEVFMDIMAEGSKYEMHFWQHYKILDYVDEHGVRPPWNKSNW